MPGKEMVIYGANRKATDDPEQNIAFMMNESIRAAFWALKVMTYPEFELNSIRGMAILAIIFRGLKASNQNAKAKNNNHNNIPGFLLPRRNAA